MSETAWEVEDEEGSVDSSQKRRLLELRRQIDEREDAVLSEQRVGAIDAATAANLIGDTVRRYLRGLEPLMRQTENGNPITADDAQPVLDRAEEVFLDTILGEVKVPVPEEIAEIPETPGAARGSADCWLSGKTPGPKRQKVQGLLGVITNEQISAVWEVEIRFANPDAGQARVRKETFRNAVPMPREILQNAVREADMWVQQVGLGINIDRDGLPMAQNFDQSRDDAEPTLSTGRADESPEL